MKNKLLVLVTILIVVLSVFALSACNYDTEVGEELILNGDFEATDENASGETVISNWTRGSLDSSFSKSSINLSKSASDGTESKDLGVNTLKIENTEGTATYVSQSIDVDRNKAYKITLQMKLPSDIKKGVSDYAIGAHITFLENTDYVLNEITSATDGWKDVTIYVSPKNTDVLTLCLKLGSESETAKGIVYYDNISMKRVDEVPTSATVQVINAEKVVRYNETEQGIVFTVLLSLLSVALMIVAYVLIRRIYGKRSGLESIGENIVKAEGEKVSARRIFLHPIAIASYLAIGTLLIRFILLFTLNGFGTEMTKLITIARGTTLNNPTVMYSYLSTAGFGMFEPGKLYLLHVFGGMGAGLDDANLSLWLRVPAILADIAVVLTIYFYGKKYVGNKLSTVYAGLYALLPVIFVMSSAKGAFESILIALLLIAFITLIEKKYIVSYILFTLAVLFDIRALAVILLAISYLIYVYYRADSTLKSFNKTRAIIIFGFVGSLIVYYALSVPFTVNYLSEKPFYILTYYKDIMATNLNFSGNAFNLYAMASMNGKAVNNTVSIFNLIFLLVLQIYVISLYIKNKNRLELLLLASFEVAIIAVFTLKVDYTYLFMSLALLMVYTMISGEKRAFIVLGGLSLLTFLNVGQLMNQSGFIGAETIDGIVSFESLDVYLILFSVVTVLTVLYYGYLTYSICNNNKKCDIPAMNEGFFTTTKNFFIRLKKKITNK